MIFVSCHFCSPLLPVNRLKVPKRMNTHTHIEIHGHTESSFIVRGLSMPPVKAAKQSAAVC